MLEIVVAPVMAGFVTLLRMNLGSEDRVAKHRGANFHVLRDVPLPDTRTGAQTLHIGKILRRNGTRIEQALGAIVQGNARLLEALER
jgi:hypothetical protein